MNIRKLSFRRKLIFAFVVSLLIVVAFGFYTDFARKKALYELSESTKILAASESVSKYTIISFSIMKSYILAKSPAELELLRSKLIDNFYNLNFNIEILREHNVEPYLLDLLESYIQAGFKASQEIIHIHDVHLSTDMPEDEYIKHREQEDINILVLEDSQAKIEGTLDYIHSKARDDFRNSMDAYENTQQFFYRTLLAIFIVSIFISLCIELYILDPIVKLEEAAKKVGEGNFDVSVKVNSDDEIGCLFSAFNHMVTSLKASQETIIQYTKNIEHEHKELADTNIKLRDAFKELQEIDDLKDHFLSHVSHELRTPLTNIRTYNQIIYDGLQGKINKDQRKSLRIVIESVDDLTKIVNNILELSKYEAHMVSYHMKNDSIKGVIEEVAEEFKPVLSKIGAKIKVDYQNKIPSTVFDYEKMKEVFINLMSNSIKFRSRSPLKITMAVQAAKGWIKISVIDNGMGIPSDKLSNLFNKFYQVEQQMTKPVSGSGLGLSIVKKIIEGHNGKIEVDSDFGKGSVFTIFIPVRKLRIKVAKD